MKQGVTDDSEITGRERERERDEPGYEEDIDSTQANTNHIMHNQLLDNHLKQQIHPSKLKPTFSNGALKGMN